MKESKEKDYYFQVLVTQILIFVFLTVLIYFFGSEGDFKNNFLNILKTNIDRTELNSAVETFKKHLYTGEIFTVMNINDDFNKVETETTNSDDGVGGKDIPYNKAATNTSYSPVFATVEPTNPIEDGRYTSYFGYRTNPISGKFSFHSGVDIAAPQGTKIRAVFTGKVIKSGFDEQAGNYLYLSHNDGFVTFYCHCSELLVENGTSVRQGETIALVGSTGYSTGPHLHFEIRKNNIRYNPLWLLEK